ncbi:hypothetical protein QBC35DRAFT_551987 [Podospora australis]|uniref:Uncharacterized protein n=1 Tax=Podospora australis TaxID=1536484 RepID=A0AAN7AG94_9PEZI|nr:hypothetical protein QBC35DRAFT_551987 [Podospora australis]
MDPLSALGIAATVLRILDRGTRSSVKIANRWRLFREVYEKDGLTALLLLNLLPESFVALERIERVLQGSTEELLEYRQSITSNMNMVAVARELNGLIGRDEIADWLSRPMTEEDLFRRLHEIPNLPAIVQDGIFTAPETRIGTNPNRTANNGDITVDQLGREPSSLSAIMIATPSGMLILSLNMLVLGLGIYLGSVYTRDLKPHLGKDGALGMLIFYIVFATIGTFLYPIPQILKSSEQDNLEVVNDLLRQYAQQQQQQQQQQPGAT